MATSSGNSVTRMQNSGSEGDLQQMDERKRKRMASNRESARRSRMRKQKHLDDLLAQVEQLKRENNQILQTINLTSQQYLNVEAENSVLKAQMNELNQRLQSLNDIINYMNTLCGNNGVGCTSSSLSLDEEEDNLDFLGDFGLNGGYFGNFTPNNGLLNNNPWNLGYLNHPIMASADVLQY